MKYNLLQRFFSLFYPIRIATAVGKSTPIITLYRFQGRWQLAAASALYSDGHQYRPLTSAFSYLKKELASKQNMLVLGAGLGSALAVLHSKNIYIPATLVDIDPNIVAWGESIEQVEMKHSSEWIVADVATFVAHHYQKYDLIIVDVFQDRTVPQFVSKAPFLQQCQHLMSNNNSVLVLNYIINHEDDWRQLLKQIEQIFKIEHTITIGINRILILRNNA